MPCTPSRRFSGTPGAGGRLPPDGESQPEDAAPADPQPDPGKAQDPFRGNGSRDQPRPHHHLDPTCQTGTDAHRRDLGRHQLDRGGDSHRQPRRHPFRPPMCFSPACAPRQKRCCNWCETAGALRAGTGSATPSSMRMLTFTAVMAPPRWPRCEPQLSTCCACRDSDRSGLACGR